MKPLKVTVSRNVCDFAAGALAGDEGVRSLYLLNFSEQNIPVEIDNLPSDDYRIWEFSKENIPSLGSPGYGRIDSMLTGKTWKPEDGGLEIPSRSLVLLENH